MHWFNKAPLSILFLIGTNALAADELDPAQGWKLVSRTKGVEIYGRPHSGTRLKEFKAIGTIEAPTQNVNAVIADFDEYPKFMPFTTESRLIRKENDSTHVGYQRLSPKIVSDRDFTLRVSTKSSPSPNGPVYVTRWKEANELGPPETKGVVRIPICEGGWLLEPAGPGKTRATYSIYTDTGGLIPPLIANYASETAISRVFEAIRKQVKNPKYAVAAER